MNIPSVKDHNEYEYLYEDDIFNVKMLMRGNTCKNCCNITRGGGASRCLVRNKVVLVLRETVCKLHKAI